MNSKNDIIDISGKTVLLTGSTGYLGRHMAEILLQHGAKVIMLARSKTSLDKQVVKFEKKYGQRKVTGFAVDFYNRDKLKSVLSDIVKNYDIDALVNNAYDLSEKTGFNTKKGTLEKITYDEWLHSFESGIFWPALATQIVGEDFKKNKKGSIINISSMYGIVSPDPRLYKGKKFLNPPTYSVAKAGLLALTRYTASFWGEYGIRCNAIAPGSFPNTESISANSVKKNDNFMKRLTNKTVLGRVGKPGDLFGALIFLVSDASSYMNGSIINIDGGWTTK